MNGSKCVVWAVGFLFVLICAGCGGSKYGDLKDVMNAQARAMENYVSAMETAGSAQDVVAAVNNFTGEMKALIPEMKKAMERYPELAGTQEPPEELKTESEALDTIGSKMQGAMMKIMQYMQDPGVQKAMEEQGKVMMEMAQK